MTPPIKLADPVVQVQFLAYINAGHGQYDAARLCDVSPTSLRRYKKSDAEFNVAVEAALDEATEPVIEVLRVLALAGDVRAAALYLKHQAPATRSDAAAKAPAKGPDLPTAEQAALLASLDAKLRGLPTPKEPDYTIPYDET